MNIDILQICMFTTLYINISSGACIPVFLRIFKTKFNVLQVPQDVLPSPQCNQCTVSISQVYFRKVSFSVRSQDTCN